MNHKDCVFDIKKTGYKISSIMHKHHITIEELAARCGISGRTISNWLSGGHNISMENACRVCKALNVKLDDFVVIR